LTGKAPKNVNANFIASNDNEFVAMEMAA